MGILCTFWHYVSDVQKISFIRISDNLFKLFLVKVSSVSYNFQELNSTFYCIDFWASKPVPLTLLSHSTIENLLNVYVPHSHDKQ